MENPLRGGLLKRPRRWILVIGLLLLALFGAYEAFNTANEPAPIQDARQILVKYAPGFNPANYRAAEPVKSADGRFWQVKFVKTGGNGQEHYTANVPNRDS
jgi:hypothetical protein